KIVPEGFFMPVTPGTKLVSIGGAIAADIHGKNHHKEGSLSQHLLSLEVLTEHGDLISCSRDSNPELFWATCGGMGLTGLIISVSIQLKSIQTSYIKQTSIKVKNLEEAIDLIHANIEATYSVAWIDTLKKGKSLGRSLLLLGEHAGIDDLTSKQKKQPLKLSKPSKINVPF